MACLVKDERFEKEKAHHARQARWCQRQQEEVFLLLGVAVWPVDHSPQIHDK